MPELKPVYALLDARDQILDAALGAFAKNGFHGATMRDIANRAEVSQSLVQYHFKSKSVLWNTVGEQISSDFLDYMSDAIAPQLPADEGFESTIRRYMRYWKEHPQAFRFNLWRLLEGTPEERGARSKRLNSKSVPVIQRAQEAGFVRDDMPPGLVLIIMGALIQFWLHSQVEVTDALAVSGDALPDEEVFLEHILALVKVMPKNTSDGIGSVEEHDL